MRDINTILKETALTFRNKSAIICSNQEISFDQLYENVLKLANSLRLQGVLRGDKIAVYLPNCAEYVYAYLASFCLGAVCVPLDYQLKEDELTSILSHSGSKILIAIVRPGVDLESIKKNIPSLENVITIGEPLEGSLDYYSLISNSSDAQIDVEINQNDPALIMYTSGTTGNPKGVVLNYKHLEGSPEAMKYFVDLTDKDVKLCSIPLSHIGGFIYIQNCIHFGITVVLMQRFIPFQFLELVQKYKVTCFHIVPPMYNAILTLKEIEKFDLSSLRWVVVFGAPSSPEVLARFNKYCPNAKLLNGWGMTETCPPNTVTPMNSDNIASIGKPAPNCVIKILDDDGNSVSIGQVGEIVISGWIVMDGYYKDREFTDEVKKPEGLHTGDLGRFDENGFLYIVGRKKEMIKVGGQLVYAPEVESAFYKNDQVKEVAVIGIKDDLRGEAIKAFIVLADGSLLSENELKYFAKDHLAHFKVPAVIEIREELPKNRTGKIDKAALATY